MHLRPVAILIAGLTATIFNGALAQPLYAERKVISSSAAHRLVEACMALHGKSVNGAAMTAIALAVVDPAGNLLAFEAMEGATESGILTAQLKAKTAARWRRTTQDLFDRVNHQVNRAPEWVGDFPQPGGYPIFLQGELLGAVGAGGGAGMGDEECAKAAIAQVFGNAVATARAP